MNRAEFLEYMELFKRAKSLEELYEDKCYNVIFKQNFGDRINYDDVINAMFHVENAGKYLIEDIDKEKDVVEDSLCLVALDSLKSYIDKLFRCVRCLREINSNLYNKSLGSIFSYSILKYIREKKDLDKAMKEFDKAGNILQDNYEKALGDLAKIQS